MTAIQEQAIKTEPFDDLIADFNKIRSLYTVEEPLEAFKLIIEQEVMLSVILEAHSQVRELFPSERLALEVKTDPEIANWRSLWITIYTKLEVDEAFEKLMILDDTWWLDKITTVTNSKLHISLGFESNEI
ncbi:MULTISPECIES: peptidase [unclassified Microcoleus]|uniref:peptidase n=1 Tax=unclassified Microcoleus TaxID=2642155 RepID=UPI001D6D93E9|nr:MULTISPECIES: peptidase [unclassified Microcoleus]MCC3505802.1 peptidase [Microcoleus sp. PH2017_19_SFW_U_A]TAG97017.1 MAG: peptidase [Oscillatoriales cyanobacterium]MCC3500554.1 peptidase [Microcoleus sp. PH2017_15_JOR_U_A]MCC3524258.1 peptidase [Microcoleus sp. PH2017_20_SFW_D_A]MCC3554709.1 peptidase [Microcoleus sp. PH2017_35_SFW_U_B]